MLDPQGDVFISATFNHRVEEVYESGQSFGQTMTKGDIYTVAGTVSASGSLTGTTSYDAWGNSETAGGLTATMPFGYAGGYTDPTGLIYLVNRYYDPQTGQFTSADPAIAQTVQPYAYANGNPVSYTDPSGACNWWCEGFSWSAAGIVGGLCGALTAEDGLGWICWGLGNGVFDAVSYWWDAPHPRLLEHCLPLRPRFRDRSYLLWGGRSSSAIGRQDIRSDRLGVGANLLRRVAYGIGHSRGGKHASRGLWFWIKSQL